MVASVVRRLAVIGVWLVAAGLVPSPAAAIGSDAAVGLTNASYLSPTWGYAVRWRRGEWTADNPTSANGDDVLQLRKPDGEFIRYEGTARFGDDSAACRDDLLESLGRLSAVSDLAILLDGAGNPVAAQDAVHADGLYDFQFQQNGATSEWKAWLACQSLVPGRAVLATYYVGPSRSFDEQHEQAQRVIPSRRSVFPYAEAARAPGWKPASACDRAQPEPSTAGKAPPSLASPAPGMKQVSIELRYPAGEPFPVTADASSLFLLDANDVVSWPVAFRWTDGPSGPSVARQTIPAEAGADLVLWFEIPAGAKPASVQTASLGRAIPTLAGEIGCLGPSNGVALRPLDADAEPPIRFVLAPDGTERGMVTWLDHATDPSAGDLVLLDFANTGRALWEVDPRTLIAENALSVTPSTPQTKPQTVLLDADPATPGPPRPAAGPIALAPGEHVVVRLSFPAGTLACARLLFVPTPSQYVALNDPHCFGEAGAAPIIRTGE